MALLLAVAGIDVAEAQAAPTPHYCLWYSGGPDQKPLTQYATDTNTVTRVVTLKDVNILAMNGSDCGVWAVSDKQLHRFDANGTQLWKATLKSLGNKPADVSQALADPVDNALWLTDEKSLTKIATTGQVMVTVDLPSDIKTFALAADQSLWALGKKTLSHYSAQGQLLSTLNLHKVIDNNQDLLAVDALAGVVWLGKDKQLTRFRLAALNDAPLQQRLPDDAIGFALNPLSSTLWVLTEKKLLAYNAAGQPGAIIDLKALGLKDVQKVGVDPVTQSLWVSAKKSLSRFTAQGGFIGSLTGKETDGDFATPAFLLTPTVSLARPPALTNNPTPTISYAYGALCNGQPCGFGPSAYSSYTLAATLNQKAIGPFVFEAGTGQTSYTLTSRLPEGTNTLVAQATDAFGHLSPKATDTFILDTIAPKFLSLSPTDGSVTNTPVATIQGGTDDPLANIILSSATTSVSTTPNNSGSFSFPVILKEGANSFELTAWDRANNSSKTTLRLTYSALAMTMETPAKGTTITDSSVLVSGTFQGPVNTGITVNGRVAAQSGNRFYAQVPLNLGVNAIQATATTPTGEVLTQTLNVTANGPAPIRVTASAASGPAPLTVSFAVQNATTATIARIEADFNGDGIADATAADTTVPLQFVYGAPGPYPAVFKITDSQGNVTTNTVTIVVEDAAQIDQALKAQWKGFLGVLTAKDKAKALQYLNARAQAKYGPIFDVLMPEMPGIVATYSALQTVSVFNEFGEYAVNRTLGGINRVFLIYFLRDSDGVWRLDSM